MIEFDIANVIRGWRHINRYEKYIEKTEDNHIISKKLMCDKCGRKRYHLTEKLYMNLLRRRTYCETCHAEMKDKKKEKFTDKLKNSKRFQQKMMKIKDQYETKQSTLSKHQHKDKTRKTK